MEKKEEEQEEKENASGENVQQLPQPQPAPPPDAELGDPLTCEEYLSIIIGENIVEPLSGAIGEFADGFQRKSEKTTLPSILGSAAGGFVVGGACGMIEDAADVITHLPEAVEGMENVVKDTMSNPQETVEKAGNKIKEYFNETWINGNPNDWAWEGGKIGFDAVLTVVTGGMEAGAETGAQATVSLAKEGMEEVAEAGIKQGARKQGKEILGDVIIAGAEKTVKEVAGKAMGEVCQEFAQAVTEKIKTLSSNQLEGGVVRVSESGKYSNGKYTGGRTEQELKALAEDPAHSGSKRPIDIEKGQHEAKVGLELEERGSLKNITRDATGKAEFIDGNGQAWDVKSFNSNYKPNKGGFRLDKAMNTIKKSLSESENVIIDTSNMSPEHIIELKKEIKNQGLEDNVLYWP